MKRPRGTGSIFPMKGSSILWVKYHRGGKAIRESSGTSERKKAEKFLQKRLAEVSTNTYTGPKLEKILVTELADDLIRDYRVNGLKSLPDVEARWALHLEPFFGVFRAVDVTTPLINRYIDSRQQAGASNATINRELAALRRMFSLAYQSTPRKVTVLPQITMLSEDNVRTGFLESGQYDKLAVQCSKIGLWLRTMLEIGYTFGWRVSEITSLRVGQIDLLAETIRLAPGSTKNRKARVGVMTGLVRELLTQCIVGKNHDDFVFTRNNKPVRDFRGAWK